MSKSFLLLFFKKEVLPSFAHGQYVGLQFEFHQRSPAGYRPDKVRVRLQVRECRMYACQWHNVEAGHATLVSMDDLQAPDRETAKRMVKTLFPDEAAFRGANRIILQDNGAHEAFWTYSGA
jgi:hypothetical protein